MKMCKKFAKLLLIVCLVFGLTVSPFALLKAQAAEVVATVNGTILAETTAEILKLSTKEGTMEIKLDSDTDTSNCKILLPGKKIFVSVSHGSDGYLHAETIKSDGETTTGTLDTSTMATVTGTLDSKTTNDILHLKTPQGDMEIKLDIATSIQCNVLIIGKAYSVTCARGSDAYMHALSITDSSSTAATLGTATSLSSIYTTTTPANVTTSTVTGTVSDKSKENLLYLSTKDGEMQFLIDINADTNKGMILTKGSKLTVTFYHGSDAYLHATKTEGIKDSYTSATIDTSSTSTVTGTVNSKSTENILYFDTPQGQMELKLDAVASMNNCKMLVAGKKLSISCAYGSDAYMHAINISGV